MVRIVEAGLSPASDSTGDADEFEGFFRNEITRLVRTMYLLTGDAGEAEDVAQEAFVRVLEHWPRVSRMESPAGYLYRVAFNLDRGRRRRLLRRPPRLIGSSVSGDPAEAMEEHDEILRALGELPVPLRQAVVLVEWLGFGQAEAAATLGIKASNLRVRLHRARQHLKERLREAEGDEG